MRTYHGEPDTVEGQETALSKKYCHGPSFYIKQLFFSCG